MIIGIMQNMWSRDPERVARTVESWRQRYDDDVFYHMRSRLTERALFSGCLTGRQLQKYLGDYWTNRIRFDEASETVTRKSSGCPPANPEHIRQVIEAGNRDGSGVTHVIAFGKIAEAGLGQVGGDFVRLTATHPAARDKNLVDKSLRELRETLDALL